MKYIVVLLPLLTFFLTNAYSSQAFASGKRCKKLFRKHSLSTFLMEPPSLILKKNQTIDEVKEDQLVTPNRYANKVARRLFGKKKALQQHPPIGRMKNSYQSAENVEAYIPIKIFSKEVQNGIENYTVNFRLIVEYRIVEEPLQKPNGDFRLFKRIKPLGMVLELTRISGDQHKDSFEFYQTRWANEVLEEINAQSPVRFLTNHSRTPALNLDSLGQTAYARLNFKAIKENAEAFRAFLREVAETLQ